MVYRVILTRNGEYKKTLHKCKTRETAFINFHKLRKENKVLFPQRFINTKGIKPVKYEICITKPTEPTDSFRTLRDKYGKVYIEKPLGDWTILHSEPYDVEETFWVYGMDSLKNRPNITTVMKKLAVGAHKKKMVKQVLVVHNKLVLYNEDYFDMVICKCKQDAQRLHHTLAKICKDQKIKSFIFMGTATPATINYMYGYIQEQTGWRIEKIRRRTTRP
jgi:hypothetical protein